MRCCFIAGWRRWGGVKGGSRTSFLYQSFKLVLRFYPLFGTHYCAKDSIRNEDVVHSGGYLLWP